MVTLTLQRSILEDDQEIVKRSGRDESVWVVIHLYMEAMLGISLYSYSYLKLAKTLCLSYYCLCSFGSEQGRGRVHWAGGRNGPNNVCICE
jgi:hypothetical protein